MAGLKWLPYGGLYLTGGLTPKNIDQLKDPQGPFMRAFRDKGRVSGMLNSVPVYAVLVEDLGERGAKFIATKLLRDLEGPTLCDQSKDTGGAKRNCVANDRCGECIVLKRLLWVSLVSTGLIYFSSFLQRK